MKRIKNAEFRMKNLVIIFCISFLTLNSALLTHVSAADSSPSADIKTKLDALKKEIASKAAKLKTEVDRKLKDKAYIGKIKSKTDTSLTVSVKSGTKIVTINQDTVFESDVKGKKFSQKIMKEEDYIGALGDIDETGVLTAKKIILLPEPPNLPKSYLWGQISSIDKLVNIKNKDSKNIQASIPASFSFKLNDFVILVGNKDKNDVFQAEFIYVLPQGVIIKKKVATPAAQTATKSATTKPASR